MQEALQRLEREITVARQEKNWAAEVDSRLWIDGGRRRHPHCRAGALARAGGAGTDPELHFRRGLVEGQRRGLGVIAGET